MFKTEMKVLLMSIVLYLAGVAVVLYVRPAYMFQEDGRWKEFGMSGPNTTLFPVWMFCMAWALVSYFVSRVFASVASGENVVTPAMAVAGVTSAGTGMAGKGGLVEAIVGPGPDEDAVMPLPTRRGKAAAAAAQPPKGGYYKFSGGGGSSSGGGKRSKMPKYIFVSQDEPSDFEEEED